MAKKELTADAKIKNWEKKMSKKLDFLIVGIFFLIFAASRPAGTGSERNYRWNT